MKEICVHIPSLKHHETVEVAVTLDGQKRLSNYRVEPVNWPQDVDLDQKIASLRSIINNYDTSWELVQIGIPDGDVVPVMFRQRARA